jgi:ABC-type dipeptide/oligopeptide/nickel transport system permease component
MWVMGAFILRRLALGLLAMFVALSGSFFFFAAKFLPLSETPILHSYWVWLRGIPSGRSLNDGLLGAHLVSTVGHAFGRTMLLLALTLVIVVVIAIPVGCLAAAMRGSVVDYMLRIGTYIAWAVPVFVVAILLQEGLGRIPGGWGTGWFPSIGWAGECPNGQGIDPHNFQCPAAGHGLTYVGEVIYHLMLPALALALGFIGLNARYLRNSVVDALDAPFVTVARGKGLPERVVVMRHAFRNALVAFVPAIVSDIGVLFGAALVVDVIFQLRGLGTLFIGLLQLDADGNTPVDTYELQLMLLFAAGVMLAAAVIGEILLGLFDPRTRLD